MLSDPNSRPYPIPPSAQPQGPPPGAITIQDLIILRINLEQIKEPGPDLRTSMAHIDKVILAFTSSLKGN
jgi:hypothetical protein